MTSLRERLATTAYALLLLQFQGFSCSASLVPSPCGSTGINVFSSEGSLRLALQRASQPARWHCTDILHISANIHLTSTLEIHSPLQLVGRCAKPSGRCRLAFSPSLESSGPLVRVSGPTAVVQLTNLLLTSENGAAVVATNYSKVSLQGSEVSFCTARVGAAVTATAYADVSLTDCLVRNNTATHTGGAIYAANSSIHVVRSVLTQNSARIGGGVYLAAGSELFTTDSIISDNHIVQSAPVQRKKGTEGGMPTQQLNAVVGGANIATEQGGSIQAASALSEPRPLRLPKGGAGSAAQHLAPHTGRPSALHEETSGRASQQGERAPSFGQQGVSWAGDKGQAAQHGAGRSLLQDYNPAGITSEHELRLALEDRQPFITLVSHIVLGGDMAGPQSLLPSIVATITITGDCPSPFGGLCVIDANSAGRIFFADNQLFMAGVVLRFENIRLARGAAPQGGALLNAGGMQVEFVNCEFVENRAEQGGGGVALVEGASGLFEGGAFRGNQAGGTGGAVLLTGGAYFRRTAFDANSAGNGGGVGVGGSSLGIAFEECSFEGNAARIFGGDVYLESWVATTVYVDPLPLAADVWPPTAVQPLQYLPKWVYTEEQLWEALNYQNLTITLGSHIMLSPLGRWFSGPPPPITGEVTVLSQCEGFGGTCIIDMQGSPNPLLLASPGAILHVRGVRFVNAGSTTDGAAVQLTAPRRAVFQDCDFMSNQARSGGAVVVRGATDVTFTSCKFGINMADREGGAVMLTGSTVIFQHTAFYQNTAGNGGAVALGPLSKAFFLDTNFSGNSAARWGSDIFVAAPVGSSLYFNRWPPPAAIFPTQAETSWYFAPPPAPPSPPSPPPQPRGTLPSPGPRTPLRQQSPPMLPPSPPPSPAPPPPSPPMGHLVKGTPFMWGPAIMAGFGAYILLLILLLLCCHKRILPRVENLEERKQLEKQLMTQHSRSAGGDSDLDDDLEDRILDAKDDAMQNTPTHQACSPALLRASLGLRHRTGQTPHAGVGLGPAALLPCVPSPKAQQLLRQPGPAP